MANSMEMLERTRALLRDTLQLGERASRLEASSALLGAIAELDSMAVVGVLTAAEDEFGIVINDDDVSAETFATLGSLSAFIESKLA
jgi:acyl carrier protein